MPDVKISALAAKATPDPSDLLVIVDVVDTSMAPPGVFSGFVAGLGL